MVKTLASALEGFNGNEREHSRVDRSSHILCSSGRRLRGLALTPVLGSPKCFRLYRSPYVLLAVQKILKTVRVGMSMHRCIVYSLAEIRRKQGCPCEYFEAFLKGQLIVLSVGIDPKKVSFEAAPSSVVGCQFENSLDSNSPPVSRSPKVRLSHLLSCRRES